MLENAVAMAAIISARWQIGKPQALVTSNHRRGRQSNKRCQDDRQEGLMRMRIAAAVLLAAGGLWWAQSRLGQVQSAPGFGIGRRDQVQGTVDIGRLPLVDVGQRGDWKVALATVADTRVVNIRQRDDRAAPS